MKSMSKTDTIRMTPKNSKGSGIASPAHASIGGPAKAGSKMKSTDSRSIYGGKR